MDILNTRETATLIWFVLIFGFLIWKADAWGLLAGLVRSFCKPIILRVVAMMAAWVAGSVWVLSTLGLWDLGNLKTTIIWFVTFALGWMVNVKRWEADPGDNVRGTIREILAVTTFTTFLAEFYTFHIVAELILVPVLSFIVVVATFAQGRKGHELVAKLFGGLMSAFGFALLGYAAYRLVGDIRGFATPETGREFAVPGLLSLLFLPFMYGLNVRAAYDQALRGLEYAIKDERVRRYAQWRVFLWFGFRVQLMRRWRRVLFRIDTTTREAIASSVAVMKAARRREREKPHVPFEFGWSPDAATRWLKAEGLDAGDYDPTFGEWSALSQAKTLSEGILGDTLRYEVAGTADIATKLTLIFSRDSLRPEDESTPQASIDGVAQALSRLLFQVFGAGGATVFSELVAAEGDIQRDGINVAMTDDDRVTRLIIRHPRHVEVFD